MSQRATRAVGLASGCFLIAGVLSAEEVSLAECLARAQTHSLEVLQASQNEARARSAADEQVSLKAPHLTALSTLDRSDDPATQLPDANKAVLHIEQSIYPLAPGWVQSDQRQAEYQAAVFARLKTREAVELLVKQLYFSILKDVEAIHRLGDMENELQKLRETVLPRFTIGRVPPFDLVKIKVSLADLERSRDATEADLARGKSALSRLLGIADSASLDLKPLARFPELPKQEEVRQALPQNPSLLFLSEQARASELSVKASQRERWPAIVPAFEYGYSGQTTSGMTRSWDLLLGLNLTLFDWGGITSRIRQQSALMKQSQSELSLEQQRTQTDLLEIWNHARIHRADEERLKDLFPEVRKAALVSIVRYRRGATSILEVSDALNLWLQTLLNERQAFYSYLSDLAGLERLSGGTIQVYYE